MSPTRIPCESPVTLLSLFLAWAANSSVTVIIDVAITVLFCLINCHSYRVKAIYFEIARRISFTVWRQEAILWNHQKSFLPFFFFSWSQNVTRLLLFLILVSLAYGTVCALHMTENEALTYIWIRCVCLRTELFLQHGTYWYICLHGHEFNIYHGLFLKIKLIDLFIT